MNWWPKRTFCGGCVSQNSLYRYKQSLLLQIYGIKHPRMLGIDGQYIYNYKHNERRGNSGVTTAKRDIKRIVRVTPHEYKKKEFSITFHGEGSEIYDIEYTCDREEDRSEIVGKLRVLTKTTASFPMK